MIGCVFFDTLYFMWSDLFELHQFQILVFTCEIPLRKKEKVKSQIFVAFDNSDVESQNRSKVYEKSQTRQSCWRNLISEFGDFGRVLSIFLLEFWGWFFPGCFLFPVPKVQRNSNRSITAENGPSETWKFETSWKPNADFQIPNESPVPCRRPRQSSAVDPSQSSRRFRSRREHHQTMISPRSLIRKRFIILTSFCAS